MVNKTCKNNKLLFCHRAYFLYYIVIVIVLLCIIVIVIVFFLEGTILVLASELAYKTIASLHDSIQ